ncbi:MAG: glutamate racemase [Desulfovibrio sp.]|uniref:glutamate racemase n=1 Tax=Desulfovibrio sp. 7SRBS1 TaxID=3378064 RepID=UPI003B40088B
MNTCPNTLPIGVFDSGVGGLTVLSALQQRLPGESFLYLGDTARVPYGTKTPQSVSRYALQATRHLVERGIKLLVTACNTASSVALPALSAAYPHIPVVGVVEPGARACAANSASGHVAVIATESTINNQAYQQAIRNLRPQARIEARPAPLLVALAEEGWNTGPVVEAIARSYLDPMFQADSRPDCLVLGCTHFPVFAPALAKILGPDVCIVDSAQTTAVEVADILAQRGLCANGDKGGTVFMATDGPERFARVGSLFMHQTLCCNDVEVVDL